MPLQLPVYLDYNATTPCDPRVVEAMLPFFSQKFGNASSRHHVFGREAEAAVDEARKQVASLIGADPTEIVFTSGATEAVNLALKGVAENYVTKGRHIITCTTEHKAVLDTCAYLEKQGVDITYLPVDKQGRINMTALEAAIRPDTVLICLMYANNETGTLHPVEDIGILAKQKGVLFFTDATQAVGKLPANVQKDGIDLLAFSAHKLYGPKGVGALYVRRKNPRVKPAPLLHGGGHERGLRSGTLNVPGIVGFGKACALLAAEGEREAARLGFLRYRLEKALLQIADTSRNGDPKRCLPQTVNISFGGVDSEGLLLALQRHVALSSGSACTSGSLEASHVLRAMGASNEAAHGALRFGVGRFTTDEEIDYVIQEVTEAVSELRALNPFWAEQTAKR